MNCIGKEINMITEQSIDPPEDKNKCFIFTCDCSCKYEITIYAEDYEKDKEYLEQHEWDDEEMINSSLNIEDVLDYKVED